MSTFYKQDSSRSVYRLLWLLIFPMLIVSCTNKHAFRVEGKFRVSDPTPVMLYLLTEDKAVLIDSTNTDEKSSFRLEGKIIHPSLYMVKFFNNQSIFLACSPGENILLDIDNTSPEIAYYVDGSNDSKLIKKLTDRQRIVLKSIDELSKDWGHNRTDSIFRQKTDFTYARLIKEHREFTLDFIRSNPQSLANIFALYQNFGRKSQPLFDRYTDVEIFDFVDSVLISLYPHTESVKALNNEVAETKEQMSQKEYTEKRIEVGNFMPPLPQFDFKGDTIPPASKTDKYTLLLFWATWNAYSVNELKMAANLHNKLSQTGLRVITISIDSSPKELEKFLSENNIMLPVICDFRYWDSELIERFAVKKIPAVLLENKEGIIVAKDIFSDELIAVVNQSLNVK